MPGEFYPFIVQRPRRAAGRPKRRIGAVTVGHMPPRSCVELSPKTLARLERFARRIF